MRNKLQTAIKNLFSEDNKLDIRNIRYLPRWAVLFIDTILVTSSLFLTYYLLKDLNIIPLKTLRISQQVGLAVGISFIFLLIFKTYAGLIRHSSYMDALKLFFASVSTFITLLIINISLAIAGEKIFISTGLIVFLFISFSALFVFRLAVKQLYEYFKVAQREEELIKAVIVGVDDGAISIAAALDIEHPQRFKIQGFASDRQNKSLRILGKPVLEMNGSISALAHKLDAQAIIFSGNTLNAEERYALVKDCLENDIKVYNSPLVINWSENTTVTDQLKSLQIEDLLNREPIVLNAKNKAAQISNKNILVTGGAGSIGSEIVRQVATFNPKRLIILDQAESPLHALHIELKDKFPDLNVSYVICDVVNKKRLRALFNTYKIDVVYHAAAYKHVPLMEDNPSEAIHTNVLGTKLIADLATEYGVGHFVMVSTDKAVNPSNVMGASKRAAEMYVQSLYFEQKELVTDNRKITKFITTRFGNVLGSNGSVVPLFKKQIEAGGPVTITHPDIIRYFMTIPEACQLVLEAGSMGKGGEIFIFDMGEPVKIMDLAEKMIKLAGSTPNEDIDIKITGLRPGEKLYEELLSDKSKTLPTHHNKIMISEDETKGYHFVNESIKAIVEAAKENKNNKTVTRLKQLIPEFKSNNSEYEILDILVEKENSYKDNL